MMEGKLTVFFDPPFWVGIFEINDDDQYRVARHVFGAEPTAPELIQFAREKYTDLSFSPQVRSDETHVPPANYKRRMREIRAQLKTAATSTRSQEIIKQDYASREMQNQKSIHEQRVADADQKYRIRKLRRVEKHRGR